jgi:hypothetical protein
LGEGGYAKPLFFNTKTFTNKVYSVTICKCYDRPTSLRPGGIRTRFVCSCDIVCNATAPLRHCATAPLRHCATPPLRHAATAPRRHWLRCRYICNLIVYCKQLPRGLINILPVRTFLFCFSAALCFPGANGVGHLFRNRAIVSKSFEVSFVY